MTAQREPPQKCGPGSPPLSSAGWRLGSGWQSTMAYRKPLRNDCPVPSMPCESIGPIPTTEQTANLRRRRAQAGVHGPFVFFTSKPGRATESERGECES